LVPASGFAVATFFLFVAPGVCYEFLRNRIRLPREESTFLHVSRVLLSGTFITAVTILLLALVRWVSPDSLLDPREISSRGMAYVADHLVLTGWTALVQFGLAILLAVTLSDFRATRPTRRIRQADAWHALSELEALPGQKVGLSVHLKSGRDVVGYYVGASTEPDPAKRELILGAPFSVRQAEGDRAVPLDPAWQRMVIAGSEIELISVAYVGDPVRVPDVSTTRPARMSAWWRRNCLTWKTAGPAVLLVLALLLVV
jgi:hypothetical protein